MEILYTNCAGLDVHKKTVKVCVLIHASNGQTHKEFRTYFTTTEELLKLCDWLKEQGCTHIGSRTRLVIRKRTESAWQRERVALVIASSLGGDAKTRGLLEYTIRITKSVREPTYLSKVNYFRAHCLHLIDLGDVQLRFKNSRIKPCKRYHDRRPHATRKSEPLTPRIRYA